MIINVMLISAINFVTLTIRIVTDSICYYPLLYITDSICYIKIVKLTIKNGNQSTY